MICGVNKIMVALLHKFWEGDEVYVAPKSEPVNTDLCGAVCRRERDGIAAALFLPKRVVAAMGTNAHAAQMRGSDNPRFLLRI